MEQGIGENSIDLVVSNCVINLCPDKEAVLRAVHRVLKPGGEMYFSDVYSTRRIPKELKEDAVLWGECLSGALYWNDFLRIARKVGFRDPRLAETRKLAIDNKKIKEKRGDIEFYSRIYRLFKAEELEDACEDYGQAVSYRGTVPSCATSFALDEQHQFEAGRVSAVCRNTFLTLLRSRFAADFEFFGENNTKHFGLFASCNNSGQPKSKDSSAGPCCS